MNAARRMILFISSIVFLGLFLFPPWYQTNGQYIKRLGRHFIFSKPESVPVECYLVGCVTAPASYFYVVFDLRNWVEPLATIAVVATALFLLLGTRTDGTSRNLADPRSRLLLSALVALGLPITTSPVVLLGTYAIYVPRIFFGGEHNWFWSTIIFPAVFAVYATVVYVAMTIVGRLAARGSRAAGTGI